MTHDNCEQQTTHSRAQDVLAEDAYTDFLRERKAYLSERITNAVQKSGRSLDDIQLCAVSKTVDVPEILAASRAGYTLFGENRPQALRDKVSALTSAIQQGTLRFDMIGNLQLNKINMVLDNCCRIQSVSSLELARALNKHAGTKGLRVSCLLEINVVGELSKSGFSSKALYECLDELMSMEHIHIEGLMNMAPRNDPDTARRSFAGLFALREALRAQTGLELSTLSCGMSDDFEIALEEGSTLIRLGRIVFDTNYKVTA
ncbi:YggS family pyridoxal phosphate-dependent enzyme [Fannyhessea vaginae]|uniref:YggS family pyridoxal phosphate-dependent enzyme n=1 Tax=Fannyhessea vaginae TaxID=82135 RepID=UPI00288983FE|nr:YggS family pyridoxal phosphate-dependent enzyme [Fannyhessea vaginae]